MKKSLTLLLLVAISLISCNNDDDNDPGNPSNDTFFAVVDGEDYDPPFVSAFNTTSINTVIITGAMGNTAEQIQIFVPVDIVPGTYEWFDDDQAFVQGYYSPPTSNDADDDGFADSGSITITENDIQNRRISGTFNFVSEPAVNGGAVYTVTNGSFSVTHTDI
ncbi:hypothetical protein GCM10009117_22700 [Gangjinia marincola]|uniref:Uncharacterized protein n=1 Tax=Gangjinia marincola TaxID=578463 RepID=A0ABP3XXH4_9FLAO